MRFIYFLSVLASLAIFNHQVCAQDRFNVFPTKSEADIPYRIPAIAALQDGTIVCVADYRHSRSDIGIKKDGRLDLHIRISPDNGKTWSEVRPLIEGKGADSPDFMNVAFGDPCIVADRKSGRMLVMSCAGNVSFPAGSRDLHQCIVTLYSDDGGSTWTSPVDVAESVYKQFDDDAPVRAMFVASGRILQSSMVKKGRYYRIYCAVMAIGADEEKKNYVLYSDDFGKRWTVLGGVSVPAIPCGADEAKLEELPDGNLLISSRTNAEGRLFNIFHYTNMKKAEGNWGEMAHSSGHNNGIVTKKNACNGELLLLPVVRNEDGKNMHLLLQSAPTGPFRANVGIYYKGLECSCDYSSSEKIAGNWEGEFRVSDTWSAYSTMALQSDSTIGFLFEEQTLCSDTGGGYTIVYDNFAVEEVTGGKYSLRKPIKASTAQ